ncbi:hypothetical protein [Agromyces bracchium]|uniref:DUF4333 domain-containing protein n=1 Tax=Agromyces bracchium TaxID=88376 RepID=A0A6I3M3L5_9MICO|nr:hypothetical protein [Agromyces bracchium]MTH67451.1 hypothetical protein [Agromyces bracchium]
MNSEAPHSDAPQSEAPHSVAPDADAPTAPERDASRPGWFARVPMWARVTVPTVIVVGGAAIVAGAVAVGPSGPADAGDLCRDAATSRLEGRGHTDIELARSLQQVEADGAQRVSGTVTFVDGAGATHHAEVRCVIRVDGDQATLASVRFFD